MIHQSEGIRLIDLTSYSANYGKAQIDRTLNHCHHQDHHQFLFATSVERVVNANVTTNWNKHYDFSY